MRHYRVVRPYKYRESEIEADHYLACGSYVSTLKLGRLVGMSRYRIRAHTKFPDTTHEEGLTTLLIVTHGILKVDGDMVKEGESRINPISITGDEQQEAEFFRIVLRQ